MRIGKSRRHFLVRLAAGSTTALVGVLAATLGVGTTAEMDAKSMTHAMVTWYDAGAPLGKFLLIRKDADLCAVRFTDYRRGHDAKPPTVFNSGEETFQANYTCRCQSERGRGFGAVTIGEVSRGASWGIGRLAFENREMNVSCGPFRLPWMYPTRVSFHVTGTKLGDHGIALAPTRWSEIEDVNVSHPRLRWFRYDPARKVMFIPLDDL